VHGVTDRPEMGGDGIASATPKVSAGAVDLGDREVPATLAGMATDDEAFQELAAYTLGRQDAAFIHQHLVDAYAVHAVTPSDKPIRIVQALVGLFLHVEHSLSGK
jgi:hypothetical protein